MEPLIRRPSLRARARLLGNLGDSDDLDAEDCDDCAFCASKKPVDLAAKYKGYSTSFLKRRYEKADPAEKGRITRELKRRARQR